MRIFFSNPILTRFYPILVLKYHSLFYIAEYLTYVDFAFTLLYYALVHWELILNETSAVKKVTGYRSAKSLGTKMGSWGVEGEKGRGRGEGGWLWWLDLGLADTAQILTIKYWA